MATSDDIFIVEEYGAPYWSEVEGCTDEEYLRQVTYETGENKGKLKEGKDLKEALDNPEVAYACLGAAAIPKVQHAKWMMHFMWESLRADLTLFTCFDGILQTEKGKNTLAKMMEGLQKQIDPATADKIAWLYSALVGNLSNAFVEADVEKFVADLHNSHCSQDGKLDAVTNLLKSPTFRKLVWNMKSAKQVVETVRFDSANPNPNSLYKCVFAYWMLSFDDEIMSGLKGSAVNQIKEFLSIDLKVEKVVRISLEVIDNFLNSKGLNEDIASSGILEDIQKLEYEKWRDQELYARITEICKAVQSKVSAVSNFDKYLEELKGGRLEDGYLHSSKFWAENYVNDKLTESVVESLAGLFARSDSKTKALACRDLGQIAVLHKLGKQWINNTKAKDQVMKQMECSERDVRREALLCCQKIMLNKWQDIPQK